MALAVTPPVYPSPTPATFPELATAIPCSLAQWSPLPNTHTPGGPGQFAPGHLLGWEAGGGGQEASGNSTWLITTAPACQRLPRPPQVTEGGLGALPGTLSLQGTVPR